MNSYLNCTSKSRKLRTEFAQQRAFREKTFVIGKQEPVTVSGTRKVGLSIITFFKILYFVAQCLKDVHNKITPKNEQYYMSQKTLHVKNFELSKWPIFANKTSKITILRARNFSIVIFKTLLCEILPFGTLLFIFQTDYQKICTFQNAKTNKYLPRSFKKVSF